jgi:hypothetical protein
VAGRYALRMATRNKPRKGPIGGTGLVPALRDAVAVVDRALEALGRKSGQKRTKRGTRRKS